MPITDATKLILEMLSKDQTLPIHTSNFIYNDRRHTQNDSGPIGLSLLVTISQIWMVNTMERAIAEAEGKTESHSSSYLHLYGRLLVRRAIPTTTP